MAREPANLLLRLIARIETRPASRRIGVKPPGFLKLPIGIAEKPGANFEYFCAPLCNPPPVWLFVQLRGPAIFKLGKQCPGYPARQQLRRNRLQARLGRWRISVEPFQRLSPPGQADRAQRRLGRVRNNRGQRIVDGKQRIEGRAELGRPVVPNEFPVPLRLSDR
jgi:hypothetical protein